MPPKKSTKPAAAGKKPASGLTRLYLFLYNALNFSLWTTCTVRTALLLLENYQNDGLDSISSIFTQVFPLLLLTQTLAGLEIFHSLVGLVRAPLLTTAMQVASRFVVVWGAMFAFGERSSEYPADFLALPPAVWEKQELIPLAAGDGLVGVAGKTQYGDFAFLGCMFAWGITEIIRYGFFTIQLGGLPVPGFWQWFRYNTFFVLYPIGIASECVLIYFSLGPAEQYVHEYYKWAMVAIMAIYVPGSYVMYTHMMSQRRRVMRGKSRVD